jgi:hypothetical protein
VLLPQQIMLISIRNSNIRAGKQLRFDLVMNKPNQIVHCYAGCEGIGSYSFDS